MPQCPQFREGTCERSDMIILEENDRYWNFGCRTCHLWWAVSKPRTVAKARYENSLRQVPKATEADRKHFIAPAGGWRM